MFGVKYEGLWIWAILIVVVVVIAAYLLSCLVLYAFVHLTGHLSFSWINGLWTFILLVTAVVVFSSRDD